MQVVLVLQHNKTGIDVYSTHHIREQHCAHRIYQQDLCRHRPQKPAQVPWVAEVPVAGTAATEAGDTWRTVASSWQQELHFLFDLHLFPTMHLAALPLSLSRCSENSALDVGDVIVLSTPAARLA